MKVPAACEEQREPIVAYVLGVLDADGAAGVEAHLAACATCRAWADTLQHEEQELKEVFMSIAEVTDRRIIPAPGHSGRLRHAWWLPAAVAAGVLLVIGLWPGEHGAKRAYGMSDVLAAVRNSTLHVRGEMYIPLNEPAGTDVVRTDCEFWVDPEHGRSRQSFYWLENPPGKTNTAPGESRALSVGERIIDGDYVMAVNHTQKWVEYTRLDDFHRALEQRRTVDNLYTRLFGQRDESGKFVQTGEKEIAGVKFAVWELEVEEPLIGMAYRSRCALNAGTGEIGEVCFWTKWRVQKDWQLRLSLTVFERSLAIPDAVFDTTSPPGYTLKNTKETAQVPPLAEGGGQANGLQNTQYISFKLPDGSVLLAWSSRDLESNASQEPLFAGLEFGGPLPKLPIEYTALRQRLGDKEVTYAGRHLAYTRDGDRFHEWSLYVAPEANALPGWWNYHQVVHRFNLPEDRIEPLLMLNVSTAIPIDDAQDFDILVRGAMAELSETRQAPEGITFERVMQLARDVRTAPGGETAP